MIIMVYVPSSAKGNCYVFSFHGYKTGIRLTESIMKAVVRLSKYMRYKFYQDFGGKLDDETEYNLEVLERWLSRKLGKVSNPIAVIMEYEEKKRLKKNKTKKKQKSSNKSNLPKDGYVYQTFLLNENSRKDNESKSEIHYWVCQRNLKVEDCIEIKSKAYSKNIDLFKSKKLGFNCLSKTDTISKSKLKILCRAKGCQKRYHTLLHPPPVNKTLAVPLQSSDSTAPMNNKTPEKNIQLQDSSQ